MSREQRTANTGSVMASSSSVRRKLDPFRAALAMTVLVFNCVHVVSPEAFTSIAGLRSLVNQEEWLLGEFDDYIKKEEERLQSIRNHANALSALSNLRTGFTEQQWDDHVTKLIGHPISAFHIIKSWYQLSQMTTDASTENFKSFTRSASERGIHLPENHDYTGALAGLLRLQKTYKLPTRELAMGQVYNTSVDYSMETNDIVHMGLLAMNVDHHLAMTWFDLALEHLENDPENEIRSHVNKVIIYKKCEDWERAYISAFRLTQLEPGNTFRLQELQELMRKRNEARNLGTHQIQKFYWKNDRDKNLESYEALCRGDDITNTIFKNKDLKCIYKKGALPYILYKEEIHSYNPRISLLIDAISDRQADMLKAKAFPSLYRAQVGDPSKSVTSEERVSKLAWLWDTDSDVKEISKNVARMTGLDTSYRELLSSAEAFQIVNYGLGGQYEPHYDFYEETIYLQNLPAFLMETGDRIATFMFYLSQVDAGGATVFPSIGVRVPPVKNAAAFWYNFDLTGNIGDRKTLHAGCPVLLGQKWVGNKWIRQHGQAFLRPCGSKIDDIDPVWTK